MGYVTFIARQESWRLHAGIGSNGRLLTRRDKMPALLDLGTARNSVLWACTRQNQSGPTALYRVTLPNLDMESVSWAGHRIGAIASAPDGERAVVLTLPQDETEQPTLWFGNVSSWERISIQPKLDISSKIAWLDATRIVCESSQRQLIIFDMKTGSLELGPLGFYPVSASCVQEWYAMSGGRVVRFPFHESFRRSPFGIEGFALNEAATLRVSADGQVFTWTVPLALHRSTGYVQQKGKARQRFRDLDNGAALGAVVGLP